MARLYNYTRQLSRYKTIKQLQKDGKDEARMSNIYEEKQVEHYKKLW
jgi:hypothetical protein